MILIAFCLPLATSVGNTFLKYRLMLDCPLSASTSTGHAAAVRDCSDHLHFRLLQSHFDADGHYPTHNLRKEPRSDHHHQPFAQRRHLFRYWSRNMTQGRIILILVCTWGTCPRPFAQSGLDRPFSAQLTYRNNCFEKLNRQRWGPKG
jgi:hypothetical protein